MCSLSGELPSLGIQFKVLRNERPVEGRHPIGDAVVLVDPRLVVGVVGRELDGSKLVYNNVVVAPVAKREFC